MVQASSGLAARAHAPSSSAGSRSAIDFLKLTGGFLGAKVMGFLAFAWLARHLTPAEYGLVETVVGMSAIGFICLDFGTGTTGIHWRSRGAHTLPTTVRAVVTARVLIAACCIPALLALYLSVIDAAGQWPLIAVFASSLLFLIVRHDWLYLAEDRVGVATSGRLTHMTVFLVFLLLTDPSANGLIMVGLAEWCGMAAMAAIFLVFRPAEARTGTGVAALPAARALLHESWPLGLSNLLFAAMISLPSLVTIALAGPVASGEIAAALRIAVALTAFGTLYFQALLPLIVRRLTLHPPSAQILVDASDRLMAWSSAALCAFMGLAAGPLVTLVFGPKLAGADLEFALLVWMVPLTFATASARTVLVAVGQRRRVLTAYAAGAAVSVLAGIGLTAWQGSEGAAIGVLLGQATTWLLAVRAPSDTIRSRARLVLAPMVLAIAVVVAGAMLGQGGWSAAWAGMSIVGGVSLLLPPVRQSVVVMLQAKQEHPTALQAGVAENGRTSRQGSE
ncbi:MAG: lipopolysaccharide biosynthesis protein [Alphaproteobacteria bacterium]